MSQELIIVKPENIQTIVSAAPQSYRDNKMSRDRCIFAGQTILDAIAQQGMTDELDRQAAEYIERARKTVKKMNERRSSATKLFDEMRKEFTVMENTIDPTKADTIPYKLQSLRNTYVAQKREEEERRCREELARQQMAQARKQMIQDIEDDFNQQFNRFLNSVINQLTEQDNALTLDNYDIVMDTVKNYPSTLPAEYLSNLCTSIRIPSGITTDEVRKAENEVKERLIKKFTDMYSCEVQDNKDYILDRLPSKKANLERIAQANATEAARIKADMEERQRKDAAAKEEERRRKEEEERAKAELARKQSEMETLFSVQATAQGYQPKVKVNQKIKLLNPEGITAIISMWWSKEGCTLSTDELSKMFKKQISFCEKLADKNGIYIEDESVVYIDEIKAK
jgi:hypothetical protein